MAIDQGRRDRYDRGRLRILLRGGDTALRCGLLWRRWSRLWRAAQAACRARLHRGSPGAGHSQPRRNIAELKNAGPLGEKTIGKPDAPVTIIEYASLGCPICARLP